MVFRRGVLNACSLHFVHQMHIVHQHITIKLIITQYVAPMQSNTFRFLAAGAEQQQKTTTKTKRKQSVLNKLKKLAEVVPNTRKIVQITSY